MQILYIGLGKMGANMVLRLIEKGHTVHAYDPLPAARERMQAQGVTVANSLAALVAGVTVPRTVWVMVPHGVVEDVLNELATYLVQGDTVIEGGNSPFRETMRRAREHTKRGIDFLDAGISGGPHGARNGACVMVGGEVAVYARYEALFRDLSTEAGYARVGEHGAGHFAKMVHNGIEYGMMQAIAEGFDLLRHSEFNVDVQKTADLYNHGSVITSRLIGWLADGYRMFGPDLAGVTGSAAASGEGAWTVETAHALHVPVRVIEDALRARTESQSSPNYQGQVVSVMRNQFGGHTIEKEGHVRG